MAGPPPRKTVEYGTGMVVSDDGAIVADRQIADGCLSDRRRRLTAMPTAIAEDKDHDLALLRIYGARGLKPLGLNGGAAKPAVELTGIADPQNQGGGAAVSSVKASIAQAGSGTDLALSPAPGLGFSGAAALDGDGKFAGIALLKPAVVAGPSRTRRPRLRRVLVPADAVRGVSQGQRRDDAASGSSDAKASVVRVICVRK